MIDADADKAVAGIQKVLDPYCLLGVELSSEKELTVQAGSAKKRLVEQGWTQFLVKVHNPPGLKGVLRAASPNAQRLADSPAADVKNRWLDLQMFNQQPLMPQLSGLALEYRIIQLYSRDAGPARSRPVDGIRRPRRATQRTRRSGPMPRPRAIPKSSFAASRCNIACDCAASHEVTFRVLDEMGKPTTAAFRDSRSAEPRLSVAGQAAGAGLRVSSADLSRPTARS